MEDPIGQRIKRIIFEHGTTDAMIADKLGISRQAVGQMINGTKNLTFTFIQGIGNIFPDVDMNWLLRGNGSISKEKNERKEKQEQEVESLKQKIEEEYGVLKILIAEKDKQIENLINMVKTLIDRQGNLQE